MQNDIVFIKRNVTRLKWLKSRCIEKSSDDRLLVSSFR